MKCQECDGTRGWWSVSNVQTGPNEIFIKCPACHGRGVHIDEHPDEECQELYLPIPAEHTQEEAP